MKRFQLKNIVIVVLLLTNVCLASVLVMRQQSQRDSQLQAAQEIVTLFESQGVSLDAAIIPWAEPLPLLTLTREESLDAALVANLLGDTVAQTDRGGGVTQYESLLGVAYFRANGSFDVEGTVCNNDYRTFLTAFCNEFGYQTLDFAVEEGEGIVTATATYRGIPVENAILRFDIAQGGVVSLVGTLLPQTYRTSSSEATTSAVTALSRFLTQRRVSGAVVSAVTAITPCYDFQTTTAQPMALVPLWQITTDNGVYLVNAVTGTVTLA